MSKPIRVSAYAVFVASVVARKEQGKGIVYKTLYLPLHKQTSSALNIEEGDVLHVAIIGKERPKPIRETS